MFLISPGRIVCFYPRLTFWYRARIVLPLMELEHDATVTGRRSWPNPMSVLDPSPTVLPSAWLLGARWIDDSHTWSISFDKDDPLFGPLSKCNGWIGGIQRTISPQQISRITPYIQATPLTSILLKGVYVVPPQFRPMALPIFRTAIEKKPENFNTVIENEYEEAINMCVEQMTNSLSQTNIPSRWEDKLITMKNAFCLGIDYCLTIDGHLQPFENKYKYAATIADCIDAVRYM